MSVPEAEYGNQKCACFIEIERLETERDTLLAKMIERNNELIKANDERDQLIEGIFATKAFKDLMEERDKLKARVERFSDAAEMLWLVLANVSGGDWTKQSADWQEAAKRWRDNYFSVLTEYRKAGEALKADEGRE